MKLRKRMLAMLLATTMVAGLAGCGAKDTADKPAADDAATDDAATDDVDAADGDLYGEHVTLTYCFPDAMGVDGYAGWDNIVAAVNEITEEKINATINFEVLPLAEYTDKMNMKFFSGEEFDVCFTGAWNPLATAVGQGAYAELTQETLETYAPELLQVLNPVAWDATTFDGKIYAAPLQQIYVRRAGIRFNVEKAKEHGFDYASVEKLEDVESYLEQLKAAGETKIFFADATTLTGQLGGAMGFDALVSSDIPGVVRYREENPTVVNQYATEEFAEYAKLIKKWNDAGYIHAEAALGTTKPEEFAVDINPAYKPGGDATESITRGWETVSVPFGDAVLTTSAITATNLAVGATSKNVERAVAFINLLNTDADLLNLLCHGIEGVDYEFVDKDNKVIQAIEGTYPTNYSFLIGNVFNDYYTDPTQVGTWEETAEINGSADGSTILGFTFNAEPVSTEIAAMQAVIDEQLPVIGSGEVEDVDAAIQKLNDSLEAAGLSTVLAEMQNQLDAWEATK